MKLIGIDYGRRRIGLAISDETGTCVRGLQTIDTDKNPDPLLPLLAIIGSLNPLGLVIGLPLDGDDNETAMSREVRKFAAKLEKSITIPVYFIDESLTSKQAEGLLRFRKKKVRRSKDAIDRIAACLILESFLIQHGSTRFTSP
jgi:putative Holliday junction resolvase